MSHTKTGSLINVLNQFVFFIVKIPFSLRQIAEPKISDSHANQSQRRMPIAAVILRTCRFLPSTNSKPDPAMGTDLRKRMGGFLVGTRAAPSGHRTRYPTLVAVPNIAAWQRFRP